MRFKVGFLVSLILVGLFSFGQASPMAIELKEQSRTKVLPLRFGQASPMAIELKEQSRTKVLPLRFGQASPMAIELKSKAEVKGPWIYLMDLGRIQTACPQLLSQLKSLKVAKAPLPGSSRVLDRNYLRARLGQKGINLSHLTLRGAEQIKVLTLFAKVEGRQLIEVAKEFAKKNLPWGEENLEIKVVGRPRDLIIPAGKAELRAKKTLGAGLSLSGFIPVPIEVVVEGRVYRTVKVNLKVKVFQKVLISKKIIRKGEEIKKEDVGERITDISCLSKDVILDLNQIKGRCARRTIRANTILKEDLFEIPAVISRGEQVTIIAALGNLQIATLGRAKEEGRVGEVIRVENIETKKELQAKVIGERRVEVEVEEGNFEF